MKYLVAGKYELEVPSDSRVRTEDTRVNIKTLARPYTWFIENKIHDVSLEMWCYEQLLTPLVGKVKSVIEYFGGSGCDATLVEGILHPKEHILVDIDEWQTANLAAIFPNAEVFTGDFFEVAGFRKADLACLDINTFTIRQLSSTPKLDDAMGAVLQSCKYAILADTAISHIWLNAELYGRIVNMEVTCIEEYLMALSCYLYEKYECSIIQVTSHPQAAYCLIAHQEVAEFDYTPAPDSAKTSHFSKIK